LLPKNPGIADWLITKALEVKYKKLIKLETLNDELEEKAKSAIANRLGVTL
jgi:CobQ-like glutamine amidotransferase family enzyme